MAFHRALSVLACLSAAASPLPAGEEADVVRSGYADVPGGKLSYEAAGMGPHVLLLSGGNWMDLREWDGQFIPFSRSFQAIRYDARGSGMSDTPTGPFSHADDLHALLDRLRIRKAHLVGLGSTAGVALDFALAHPDRVASLVLVSPSVGGYEFSEEHGKREAALLKVLKKEGAKAFARAVLDDPYLVPAGGRRKARKLLRSNAKRLLSVDPSWVQGLDPPAIGRLLEIHVPTLVVLGEEDDPEILKAGDVVSEGIPSARKVVLRGAGHAVNMERSRKFSRVVLDFLRGLPPS